MLLVKTNQLIEEMEGIKKDVMHLMIENDCLSMMDEQSSKMLMRSEKVFDLSKELVSEQAELLDEINRKLDKLLEKKS